MSGETNPKEIIFDLIARHGLVVIALGFLGWFIIDQTNRQYQETQHWRDASMKVTEFHKANADRFFAEMEKLHQALTRVEVYCAAIANNKDTSQ